MKWFEIALLFLSLGNSNEDILDIPIALDHVLLDEIEYMNSFSNPLSNDVSNDVFFYLYTREGPISGEELILNNDVSLESSFFNPDNLTKLIIHGFRDNSKNPMAWNMKDELLYQEEVNVILVDWSKIAGGIDYINIAKRTVDVGSCVARFLEFLVEKGADLDDFHLIGHSLGAHVAGFAGAALRNGTVARITGLDPAMPGFNKVSPKDRLDRSNAKFVDCIHTCSGTLGLTEAICTADFYPNGGKNIQPGCPFYDLGKCSHFRSFEFFTESIKPNHHFITQSCSVDDGSPCKPSSVEMGYYVSTSAKGMFYGVTNSEYPFALIH